MSVFFKALATCGVLMFLALGTVVLYIIPPDQYGFLIFFGLPILGIFLAVTVLVSLIFAGVSSITHSQGAEMHGKRIVAYAIIAILGLLVAWLKWSGL